MLVLHRGQAGLDPHRVIPDGVHRLASAETLHALCAGLLRTRNGSIRRVAQNSVGLGFLSSLLQTIQQQPQPTEN